MLKLSLWVAWLVALAANGFVVFLWVVFGLAAAGGQGSGTNGFIGASAIGVGLPLLASMFFMSKGKIAIGIGIGCTFAMMPLVIAFTLPYGKFLKV